MESCMAKKELKNPHEVQRCNGMILGNSDKFPCILEWLKYNCLEEGMEDGMIVDRGNDVENIDRKEYRSKIILWECNSLAWGQSGQTQTLEEWLSAQITFV